jgi:hypothetical protein
MGVAAAARANGDPVRRSLSLHGRTELIALAILLLALAVRLPAFLRSDFPLNDGGLFFVMSDEIAAAHFSLPYATSYNADGIPFTYPPLSFFLTAFLSQALGLPLIELVRYLPLIANLLAIIAFIALARSLLRGREGIFLAALAFVLTPRSYEWLVMGGGLTRSLGFLLALTALSQAVALYQRPSARRVVAVGALIGLTWLTHLEMGLFASYSLLLLYLARGRSWQGLRAGAAVALSAVALSAPWWLLVAHYHGLAPYRAASATAGWSSVGQTVSGLLQFVFAEQQLLTVLGGLSALGLIVCVLRREWLLPVWLLLVFVLTPRSAPTEAAVPVAMLVSLGLTDAVLVALRKLAHGLARIDGASARARLIAAVASGERGLLVGAVAVMVSCTALALPVGLPSRAAADPLEALPAAEREAMAWIADQTPAASKFLVLSPKASWEVDYVLEWFPALAQRKSVLTVQGSEWLAGWIHARRACLYGRFRADGMGALEEMEDWLQRMGIAYSHVYVSRLVQGPLDLDPLRDALVTSSHYRVLYDGRGGTVLARASGESGAASMADDPPIAHDCQTLFDQPEPVQVAYRAAYGGRAPWAWKDEHTREIGAWHP